MIFVAYDIYVFCCLRCLIFVLLTMLTISCRQAVGTALPAVIIVFVSSTTEFWQALLCLTLCLSLNGMTTSGSLVNPQDLAPKFAGSVSGTFCNMLRNDCQLTFGVKRTRESMRVQPSLLFNRQLSCTPIDSRALSSTLNMFKVSMRIKTLTFVWPPTVMHSHRFFSALTYFEHVEYFDESRYECKLSLLFDRQLPCTLIVSRALPSILNMFQVSMRVQTISRSFNRQLSCTLTDSPVLSPTLNMFQISMKFVDWEFKLINARSSTLNTQCSNFHWELMRVSHICWATRVVVWELNKRFSYPNLMTQLWVGVRRKNMPIKDKKSWRMILCRIFVFQSQFQLCIIIWTTSGFSVLNSLFDILSLLFWYFYKNIYHKGFFLLFYVMVVLNPAKT